MRQLIIDGYNLMYAMEIEDLFPHYHQGDLQSRREFLIQILQGYSDSKAIHIHLVFDSQEKLSPHPDRERRGRLLIEYCHTNESADDFIVQTVTRRPSHYIVISNDRFILKEAERVGVLTLRVDDFLKKLGSIKISPPEVDKEWIEKEEDEDSDLYPKIHTHKKGSSRKPSKRERKRKTALKKI